MNRMQKIKRPFFKIMDRTRKIKCPFSKIMDRTQKIKRPFFKIMDRTQKIMCPFFKIMDRTQKIKRPFFKIMDRTQKIMCPFFKIMDRTRKIKRSFFKIMDRMQKIKRPFLKIMDRTQKIMRPFFKIMDRTQKINQQVDELEHIVDLLDTYRPTSLKFILSLDYRDWSQFDTEVKDSQLFIYMIRTPQGDGAGILKAFRTFKDKEKVKDSNRLSSFNKVENFDQALYVGTSATGATSLKNRLHQHLGLCGPKVYSLQLSKWFSPVADVIEVEYSLLMKLTLMRCMRWKMPFGIISDPCSARRA